MHDAAATTGETGRAGPSPKVLRIDPSTLTYAPLLTGPPETATMRSGSVVLLPGQSVGEHSTGDHEEAIIVLSGTGEMRFADGSAPKLDGHSVAYCPPATVHDVINTGTAPLRYVYVVAKAR